MSLGGGRGFYATDADDWLTGVGLIGLSPRWVRRVMSTNSRKADAGVRLGVVGSRAGRGQEFGRRLDTFLRRQ